MTMPSGDKQREAIITLRVKPRAKKSRIVGKTETKLGAAIIIEIAAPPVSGKANLALVRFLSKTLSIPTSNISLVSGLTSPDKLVGIKGMSTEEAQRILLKST